MGNQEAILSSRSASIELSVIVPALNEGDNLRRTVERLYTTLPDGSEIVVVDDGSSDGCCDFLRGSDAVRLIEPAAPGIHLGVAGARNKGAAAARGAVLLFIDAHVDVEPGWAELLSDAAREAGVGAAAPGISVLGRPECCGYGLRFRDAELGVEWLPPPTGELPQAPLLPGACLAVRRDVFSAEGGFDPGLVRWGSEDAELSIRLWTAGYDLRLVPQVIVAHLFRERHPYAVDWTAVLHNMLRLAVVHFNADRLARVVDRLKHYRDFGPAWALLMDTDAHARRAEIKARRRRNDDDYFYRFGEIR
jgi:GT2 family glycosyltransferase